MKIENDAEMWPGWRAQCLGEPDGYRGGHRRPAFADTRRRLREQDAGIQAVLAALGVCLLVDIGTAIIAFT